MPVLNESLQAKTLKKLSPNTIKNLPSPIKTEALNEIANELKKIYYNAVDLILIEWVNY
tara:strand:- start:260 stop:436 length:177 start_codon:yes stop_codon:yes gene_type:complete